jgi:hypothetical protein
MDYKAECVLGIITTVFFHYLAFFSVVLRVNRIRKFFSEYDEFLMKQEAALYDEGMS